MIIPRVLSRGSSVAAQRAHFEAVLEAAVDLPSVIYNSPYYGYETKADLFFELRAKHKHLVGFKEFGGGGLAALCGRAHHRPRCRADPHGRRRYAGRPRLRQLRRGRRDHRHRQRAAARSVASRRARREGRNGDLTARRQAGELEAALGVLSSFDEGTDLVLYYKYLMVLEGTRNTSCTSSRPMNSRPARSTMPPPS